MPVLLNQIYNGNRVNVASYTFNQCRLHRAALAVPKKKSISKDKNGNSQTKDGKLEFKTNDAVNLKVHQL